MSANEKEEGKKAGAKEEAPKAPPPVAAAAPAAAAPNHTPEPENPKDKQVPPQTPVMGVAAGNHKATAGDLQSDEYVTMVFPRTLRVCLPNHAIVSFPEGINRVPVELADHFYFKANGVKRAD